MRKKKIVSFTGGDADLMFRLMFASAAPKTGKTNCRYCNGTGVIYSKWDIGNFDLCEHCQGKSFENYLPT
jgi:hypothetical protein